MSEIPLNDARARWSSAQGLDAPVEEPIAATLERTGWVRTLGGLAGYLALSARNPSATVEAVNEAVASGAIGVSPAVRGCIYLVPRSHEALALKVAHLLSARRIAKEQEKLDVSDAELDAVGEAVLSLVSASPLSTAQLRKRLPDGTVRSLGDAGKKMGVTSTLPPALRRLEFAGRLRRTPIDARLDHERYVWAPHDLEVGTATDDDLAQLASLYLRWAGPSTRKELASWTGLNQTQAKEALAACGAETATLGGDEVFVGSDPGRDATGHVAWLPAMDNLYALRAASRPLVDPAYADVEVSNFGSGGRSTLGKMSQPIERTIVRDGEVLGMWAWDPAADEVVLTLSPRGKDLDIDAERARVEGVIQQVGHGKVFSLDTDARMTQRADRLRSLTW